MGVTQQSTARAETAQRQTRGTRQSPEQTSFVIGENRSLSAGLVDAHATALRRQTSLSLAEHPSEEERKRHVRAGSVPWAAVYVTIKKRQRMSVE